MGKDDLYVIRLRDCFTGGYTFPQYCIDNEIKKPLFVTEEKFLTFAWEIYVQFCYDKRMTAQFSTIDLPAGKMRFTVKGMLPRMSYSNISEVDSSQFDAIILLTTKEVPVTGTITSLLYITIYFIVKTYVDIPLLHFLQRHPKVKLFITNFPSIFWYKGGREFNSTLMPAENAKVMYNKIKNNQFKNPVDKLGYTVEEFYEIIKTTPIKLNSDGSTTILDYNHPLVQIYDGKRLTPNQPEKFLNRIYIVGTCHHYGVNAPFDKTIASYLQAMLNENNLPYRVENEAQFYFNRYQDIFYNLNRINPIPGDIIFIYFQYYPRKSDKTDSGIPFFDIGNAFDPPNDYREFYPVTEHCNELGYKVLAEKYFKFLTENNFFREVEFNYHIPPPHSSQIWYTSAIRTRRRKFFYQRRFGGLQKTA